MAKRWDKKTVEQTLKENKDKSPTWFRKNEPGLVDWCNRNPVVEGEQGWTSYCAKFKIIPANRWNEKKALAFLKANRDKNYSWFKSNKSGLLFWLNTHGGWAKWAQESGIRIVKTEWTDEKVIAVFNENKDRPMQWFYENFNGMMQWCIKNGGVKYWKEKIGRESRRDFNDETVTEYLQERKDKPSTWFRSNDASLVHWCEKNGGWDNWVKKIGIREKPRWDADKALEVMKKNSNESFNWFKHHYPSLVRWCSLNGGWRVWAEKAGVETASAVRTPESVIAFMKANRDKDLMWFIRNEQSLVRWCYRNGGLQYYAEKAGIKGQK